MVVIYIFTSCRKDNLSEHTFIGNTGGTISNINFKIEVPPNAMTNGYFEQSTIGATIAGEAYYLFQINTTGYSMFYDKYRDLLLPPPPLKAKKMILSNGIVSFNSSKPNTDKPLMITMRYEMCDPEGGYFCGLSDMQAQPFALGKKDQNIDNILSDSLNYTLLPVFARDTINKTITFGTSDLTKIYLIAREL